MLATLTNLKNDDELETLQKLTEWMKAQKVQSFKIGELGIEVTFAREAMITPLSAEDALSSPEPSDEEKQKEFEKDLYYSAG